MNDQPTNQSRPAASTVSKKSVRAPRQGRGRGVLNFVLFLAIIVVAALFVRAEMERRATQGELDQKAQELQQLRETAERSGQAVADEVLLKVREHIVLPTDPAPTVATIVDIDQLRAANEFYAPAKNGDHLIITESRAILYDAERDLILDIVPVQINQKQAEEALGGEKTNADGTPAAEATPSGSATPAPSPTAKP